MGIFTVPISTPFTSISLSTSASASGTGTIVDKNEQHLNVDKMSLE